MAKKEEVVRKVSAGSVKKDAAKAAKAVSDTAKDLRNLTEQQLQAALQTAKEDLQNMQKMLKSNELPASHAIKKTKKTIARIHSVITEKNNERSENE